MAAAILCMCVRACVFVANSLYGKLIEMATQALYMLYRIIICLLHVSPIFVVVSCAFEFCSVSHEVIISFECAVGNWYIMNIILLTISSVLKSNDLRLVCSLVTRQYLAFNYSMHLFSAFSLNFVVNLWHEVLLMTLFISVTSLN